MTEGDIGHCHMTNVGVVVTVAARLQLLKIHCHTVAVKTQHTP